MKLSDLGDRICILGPSNSGKSTLADAIARKRGLELIHLDLLHHLPNTDWEPRLKGRSHCLARCRDRRRALGDGWKLFDLHAATVPAGDGTILLDISTPASLLRYFRRTLFERERRGALAGGRDSVKSDMIHHIAVTTPKNRQRYQVMFEQLDLPKLQLSSLRAIKKCFQEWDLAR